MTVRKIGETAVHSPLKRASLLVLAILFFVSATAFATPSVIYDVTIYDGDTVVSVSTVSTDAEDVLENAGITIDAAKGDEVNLTNFTGTEGSVIFIKRGVKVTIKSFDGSSYAVYASGTVSDAIEAAGITLPKGTALNFGADEILKDGMKIEIYDIFDVTIVVDGKKLTGKVSGKTVADALEGMNVSLDENDFTKPALDSEIKDGMKITVNRVTLKERTEEEKIGYDTQYTYSDSLYKDHTKVLKKGEYGSKAVVYEDRYVNGKLEKSVVKTETILKNSVSELVQVGTKVNSAPSSLPVGTPISEMAMPSYLNIGSNGLPTSYKSVINAKATAYCIPGGITSTGKKAQTGYIAVDPKEIPYGTEMYIVSADGQYVYGYCIAADTGSYIYDVDWTVDLFMNSEAQCVKWGRRDIIIYVL